MQKDPVLVSIQIGVVQDLIVPTKSKEQPFRIARSAIAKTPVDGAQQVKQLGVVGDQQAERKIHGGIDKALLVYSADHHPFWHSKVGRSINAGDFGENLTVAGLTEANVCIGDQFAIGTASSKSLNQGNLL